VAHWLFKSEPETWSWDNQVSDGTAEWDGVRNYQAANNMKAMKVGDLAFFYHSGGERQVVGIVEVAKEYYLDPTDPTGRFGMVDVKAVKKLEQPVTLKDVKGEPRLQDIALVRHSRLSVMPIDDKAWSLICSMGKTKV
jgi:predicted RNA-binding protein with PUA-like domain